MSSRQSPTPTPAAPDAMFGGNTELLADQAEMFGGKTDVMPTILPDRETSIIPRGAAYLFPPDPAPRPASADGDELAGGGGLTRSELREVMMIAFTVVIMAVELGYLIHYFSRGALH